LSEADFLAEDLPMVDREVLDKRFPRQIQIGPARYSFEYDVSKKEVLLHKIEGPKQAKPTLQYLPSLKGWRIAFQDKNSKRILRDRR